MAVAELWDALKQAIVAYTGLSPAAFFTAVAVAAALYHVVSGLFAPPPLPPPRPREEPEAEPLPPPVQLGEVTEEELKQYDGSDPKKPLLMAIKGRIYDVTQSRMFYGPGGPYALFAGKDASRALAKMSFEPQDLTGDISGLGPFELDALQDWEYKFMSKYVKVGTVKKNVPVEDGNTTSTSPATNEAATEAEPEQAPATEEKPREVVAEEVKKEASADKEATADEGAKAETEKAPATEEKPREAVAEEVKEAPADKEAAADEGAKAEAEMAPATEEELREAVAEEVKEKEAAADEGAKES